MTQNAETELCPTNLIEDGPAESDEFGGHEEVADAILSICRGERGGRAIGLAGPYGSGKSTIVRRLIASAANSKNEHVWVFDAWAHEGDPLRRSFLESLIRALVTAGWVQREKWTHRLELLARRRSETSVTTNPTITGFGFVVAGSVLAVPIGAELIAAALEDSHTFRPDFSSDISLGLVFGTLLCFAPVLAVGAKLALRAAGLFSKGVDWRADIAVFLRTGTEDKVTSITESAEPTSIEFSTQFEELLKEALDEKYGRRLTLVIDNLDRVGPSAALALWSTLQTFISSGTTGAWRDALWVVMPYDEAAIQQLFHSAQADSSQSPAATPGELATAFLEKTFHIRFDVPPPLVVDWRDYVHRQLCLALPAHQDTRERESGELWEVVRVFEVARAKGDAPPTPRELKAFVNQVGALHRLRQNHDVALVQLAYFTLLRKSLTVSEIIEGLRSGELLPREIARLLGANARNMLAALAFGTDVGKARELLLEGPMKVALDGGDSDALGRLVGPGFWEILLPLIEKGCLDSADAKDRWRFRAAASVLGADILPAAQPQFSRPARKAFTDSLRASVVQDSWASADVAGLAALLRAGDLGNEESLQAHLSSYITWVCGRLRTEVSEEVVDSLLCVAKEIARQTPPAYAIEAVDEVSFWAIVDALREGLSDEADAVLPSLRAKEMDPVLLMAAERVRAGRGLRDLRRLIESHVISLESSGASVLSESVAHRWSQVSRDTVIELNDLVSLVETHPQATRMKTQLLQSGQVTRVVALLKDSGHGDLLATLVEWYLLQYPELGSPGGDQHSDEGLALIRSVVSSADPKVVEYIATRLEPANLFDLWTTDSAKQFVQAVVDSWVRLGDPHGAFTASNFVMHWDIYSHAFSTASRIADKFGLYGDLHRLLAASAVDFSKPSLYELAIRHQVENDDGLLAALVERLRDALYERTPQQWLDEMAVSAPRPALRLVREVRRFRRPELGSSLREALLAGAQQLAAEVPNDSHNLEQKVIRELVDGLDDPERRRLADQLVDLAKDNVRTIGPSFLGAFGSELAQSISRPHSEPLVSTILLELIEHGEAGTIRWVADFLRGHSEWLRELDGEYQELLVRAAVGRVTRGTDASIGEDDLSNLASSIGMPYPPSRSESRALSPDADEDSGD